MRTTPLSLLTTSCAPNDICTLKIPVSAGTMSEGAGSCASLHCALFAMHHMFCFTMLEPASTVAMLMRIVACSWDTDLMLHDDIYKYMKTGPVSSFELDLW